MRPQLSSFAGAAFCELSHMTTIAPRELDQQPRDAKEHYGRSDALELQPETIGCV